MANYEPIRIAYSTFEPAGGCSESLAPVIFLHGSTCSKEIWDDIPQTIADKTKRRTYTYDARCHGASESSETYNFDQNVDDLFHLMDDLNIQKAVLVGHSMGSLTSTNAALRKPERVERIFSEDMFVDQVPQEVLDSIIVYISTFSEVMKSIPKELDEREAWKKAVEIIFEKNKDSNRFSSKEALEKSKIALKSTAEGGYDLGFNKEPMIRAFKDAKKLMSTPCGQFDGPICFIYGGESPFSVGSKEDEIKKHFPKAEFIEFEGASHNIHVDFPDKFTQTILNRLQ